MHAFHVRSFGIFPLLNKIKTHAVILITISGGEPNDFNSVKLFLFRVFKASRAAINAGSAFLKSSSQSLAFTETSSSITRTLRSSSAADFQNKNYI